MQGHDREATQPADPSGRRFTGSVPLHRWQNQAPTGTGGTACHRRGCRLETSRPLIEAGQHHLTVLVPEQQIFFEGDATRLTQVLVNLLNNAAKYTHAKGEIILSSTQEDDHIVMKVNDNGLGIPSNMLVNIFQLFNQLDRSEQHSQGGWESAWRWYMGIVTLHRGTVEAQSPGPGKGSEFIVRIPVSQKQTATVSSTEIVLRVVIFEILQYFACPEHSYS